MNFLTRLFFGFGFAFRGLRAITKERRLKMWSLVPFLIGLLLMIAGFAFILFFLPTLMTELLAERLAITADSKGYLYYPLFVIASILMIIFNVYLSYWITLIFSSPVYSYMAEIVQGKILGSSPSTLRLQLAVKMMFQALFKGVIFSSIGALLFLFAFFIPVLNILATFLLFFVIATDSSDYALESLGQTLSSRIAFYKKHFAEFFGLSLFIGATLIIPGFLLLVMPAVVVGVSEFVYTQKKEEKNDSRSYT